MHDSDAETVGPPAFRRSRTFFSPETFGPENRSDPGDFRQEPAGHTIHLELFDIPKARGAKRAAKIGIAVEATDRFGQRFGMVRLHEESVPNHLRDGGGARGHNGLAGGHRLQENDAETLLHTRQAKNIATVIFLSQGGTRGVAEPPDY